MTTFQRTSFTAHASNACLNARAHADTDSRTKQANAKRLTVHSKEIVDVLAVLSTLRQLLLSLPPEKLCDEHWEHARIGMMTTRDVDDVYCLWRYDNLHTSRTCS